MFNNIYCLKTFTCIGSSSMNTASINKLEINSLADIHILEDNKTLKSVLSEVPEVPEVEEVEVPEEQIAVKGDTVGKSEEKLGDIVEEIYTPKFIYNYRRDIKAGLYNIVIGDDTEVYSDSDNQLIKVKDLVDNEYIYLYLPEEVINSGIKKNVDMLLHVNSSITKNINFKFIPTPNNFLNSYKTTVTNVFEIFYKSNQTSNQYTTYISSFLFNGEESWFVI
jgi:hypothetical protein